MEPAEKVGEIRQSPSPFQRRAIWGAVTGLAIVVIGAIAVGMILLSGTILSYLQPILVPLAVAGIIAYLLDPVISWLGKRGWPHRRAMLLVYIAFLAFVVFLVVAVLVPTFGQAQDAYANRDDYGARVTTLVKQGVSTFHERYNTGIAAEYYQKGLDWISKEGPKIGANLGQWIWSRIAGAFGFFGYLLGLLLVPIYLYYFLLNGHKIAATWSDYLPLRASSFKDEVVASLTEINGYLISFFRGQMVVSLIDGALIAVALTTIGLPYALLIGVFLAILGLIPYIGNLLVMVPAILIAIAHFGATQWGIVNEGETPVVGSAATVQTDAGGKTGPPAGVTMVSGKSDQFIVTQVSEDGKRAEVLVNAWTWLPTVWAYPVLVLLIFVILQQINGLVTAPKIVGDSVGLHPLTVIFSVLFWSFLLGGLLGALLAVPLTAALKVLFRRYLWEARLEAVVGRRILNREDTGTGPENAEEREFVIEPEGT
ncbi:MAG: AI-2E family transporter [Verrucomicrobiales bacterium]|jgi:predicted PurR-regulated permease PerM|nr:AI-2E family transporter [Verrucomicrobiales bacterium]MBP9223058.1 AI-2E family transporter [Verrucomicrobiales bacterium]